MSCCGTDVGVINLLHASPFHVPFFPQIVFVGMSLEENIEFFFGSICVFFLKERLRLGFAFVVKQ